MAVHLVDQTDEDDTRDLVDKALYDRPIIGRPRKDLDLDLVYELAKISCTDDEIASVCKVSRSTIARRKRDDKEFVQHLEDGKAAGKACLRRIQWQAAHAGSAAMQIWLGKQLLGQREFRGDPPPSDIKPAKRVVTLEDDVEESPLDRRK